MTAKSFSARGLLCCGLTVYSLVSSGCMSGTSTPNATREASSKPVVPAAEASQSTTQNEGDQTLVKVSKAIRTAHLTEQPDECLAYELTTDSARDLSLVEVRENHKSKSCGGDPNTQPRLFTVRVDRKTQQMSTDSGSPGQFHKLTN